MNQELFSIVLKESLRNHNRIGTKIYYSVLFYSKIYFDTHLTPNNKININKLLEQLCVARDFNRLTLCHLFSTVLCLSLTLLSPCIYRTACTLSWNTSVVGISCIISSRSASLRNPMLCEYSSHLCRH